jgi:hypothetical protein
MRGEEPRWWLGFSATAWLMIAGVGGEVGRAQTNGISFSSLVYADTNLVLSGNGGQPGSIYYLLSSTNAGAAPATWQRVLTNRFGLNGQFSDTVPVHAGTDQSFFLVMVNTGAAFSAGVFTYHNDNLRTGQNLAETILSPANVNSNTFGKLFGYALDGLTFGSPLYVANVSITGQGMHNAVYVATEHDTVYAFDADGLSNAPLWQVSFINPTAGVTTVPAQDTGETGDIPDEIGITSTPVIDPASGTIYVVAKTKEVSGATTNYVQRLHALDIRDGAERFGGPVVIAASVPGNGEGSQGGMVAFDPLRQNQRSALLLANGVIYLCFASHGDNQPYHGWVLGYDATNLQQVLAYNNTPDGYEGGIWMNGDGPATDASGDIYFVTGNGLFDANGGGRDYGDSYERLSAGGIVMGYFTPHEQADLDSGDIDLGSSGALVLPDQPGPFPHEMIGAGKNGTIYVANRDSMGAYNGTADHVVQSIPGIFTVVVGIEGGNYSAPVYFGENVYFSPVSDHMQAFGLTNGLLSTNPSSATAALYAERGGMMSISGNGTTNGILWALQSQGNASPGTLHAYDAANLARELYNSDQAGTRDTLSPWWKCSAPVVVNGKVFVAGVGQLTVYGLLP